MKDFINLLGLPVKEKVTGFEGIVTTVSFDLYGCVQVIVTPGMDKDGKPKDGHWYDAKRLVVTGKDRVMPVPQYETIKPGKEIGAAEKPPFPSK